MALSHYCRRRLLQNPACLSFIARLLLGKSTAGDEVFVSPDYLGRGTDGGFVSLQVGTSGIAE